MISVNRKEPFILFLGDLATLYAALYLMLLVRYFHLPTRESLADHFVPFSILFAVWLAGFFIAGLYEKHTLILKSKLGGVIVNAQISNAAIAFLFFYLIPYFGITPKTNLFLFLAFSSALLATWRLWLYPAFEIRKKQHGILIGSGKEMKELETEVNNNSRYDLRFVSSVDLEALENIDLEKEILERIQTDDISVIAVDFRNEKVEPMLPGLYNLIFSKVRFVDMHRVYEDIFDRIPLSLVKYSWFLEHISGSAQKGYDMVKRVMDILLALILTLVTIAIFPFVWIAIKLEDGGPVFFVQDRVGKNNKIIRIIKFRSLGKHDNADGVAKNTKQTIVGAFLRRMRIDELPQLWNVLVGDLSLIGPRPEIPTLVSLYEKEIPYYNVRHLIKPGLSGWAQLYQNAPPKFVAGFDETRTKLSYDLYYIKNRSLPLDIKVVLRTIKTILSREGV